jgi:hypothetical protein
MPLVFRAMKKDGDGLPTVEQSASGLGIRPGIDIDEDAQGNVIVNGKGMSVSPGWRALPLHRIPKRLRGQVRGARGSDSTYCFKAGEGPFQQEPFAEGLTREPDSATHGCIAPAQPVPLRQYESDLAATRAAWLVDES